MSGVARAGWVAVGLVFAVLVGSSMGPRSCAWAGELLGRPAQPIQSAPSPSPARPPSPTQTPRPAASPRTAVPTATPQASLSQQEAQSVVQAWFDALGAEDYRRMEELTAEKASPIAKGVADAIQLEASTRQVQIDLVVQRLEFAPSAQPQKGQAVRSAFEIEARAIVGPLSIPARQIHGGATFLVERVDGEAKITNIYEATGLPAG